MKLKLVLTMLTAILFAGFTNTTLACGPNGHSKTCHCRSHKCHCKGKVCSCKKNHNHRSMNQMNNMNKMDQMNKTNQMKQSND